MEMDAATGLATRSDEAPETSPVRPDGRANFVLPARGVAVAAFILAVACLGTLAIVADQNNADALSTIALALAVLAFSVQIIVYVAQAATSHQQMLRSEQLNTETSSLLVDVRGSADATQLLVREQFSNVLSAFIEGVNRTVEHKPEPSKEAQAAAQEPDAEKGADEAETLTRLLENVRREVDAAATSGEARIDRPLRPPVMRKLPASVRKLQTWPPEDEGRPSLEVYRRLNPEAQVTLKVLADDEIRSLQGGSYVGLTLADVDQQVMNQLADEGLVIRARIRNLASPVWRLTDAGRDVARLTLARGEIPAWAAHDF